MSDGLKILGLVVGVGALAALGGVAFTYFGAASSVATAPARAVERTMRTDNMIQSYEFFHDAHNAVLARVAQIKAHKQIVAQTQDAAELSKLRMELAAQQQSCRDTVAKYNANSAKANHAIFKGQTAPESLDMAVCE